MQSTVTEGYSISDLEIQKLGLIDRIKRLEADLREPLEANSSEQAGQLTNRIILKRILEVEMCNLGKVDFEIEKKKQGK
jgi:hypothetical protein